MNVVTVVLIVAGIVAALLMFGGDASAGGTQSQASAGEAGQPWTIITQATPPENKGISIDVSKIAVGVSTDEIIGQLRAQHTADGELSLGQVEYNDAYRFDALRRIAEIESKFFRGGSATALGADIASSYRDGRSSHLVNVTRSDAKDCEELIADAYAAMNSSVPPTGGVVRRNARGVNIAGRWYIDTRDTARFGCLEFPGHIVLWNAETDTLAVYKPREHTGLATKRNPFLNALPREWTFKAGITDTPFKYYLTRSVTIAATPVVPVLLGLWNVYNLPNVRRGSIGRWQSGVTERQLLRCVSFIGSREVTEGDAERFRAGRGQIVHDMGPRRIADVQHALIRRMRVVSVPNPNL